MSHTIPTSLRIGVIRGGPSSEYDVSIKSGSSVLKSLGETHRPIDIFISQDGKWHIQGVERSPERILKTVDVVFNALHGEFGEDGKVQEILDHHGVPYTGSDKYSSAIAMNKHLTKEKLKKVGIKTPIHFLVRNSDNIATKAKEVWATIPHPMVVKPATGGSSLGVYKVESFQELINALEEILSKYNSAIVEEYIKGKEATCGVVNHFRQKEVYVLPPVEIVRVGDMFDYDSKYGVGVKEICPGNFSQIEKKEIERLSELVHRTLELSHYSRSDFIISPRRGIYFLEVNTLPGLTKKSLLPKALESVGVSIKEFVHHVIGLALGKK